VFTCIVWGIRQVFTCSVQMQFSPKCFPSGCRAHWSKGRHFPLLPESHQRLHTNPQSWCFSQQPGTAEEGSVVHQPVSLMSMFLQDKPQTALLPSWLMWTGGMCYSEGLPTSSDRGYIHTDLHLNTGRTAHNGHMGIFHSRRCFEELVKQAKESWGSQKGPLR
jgi:hypothetical protein